jgi:D-alanyl-D-alanine carboxypeptidase (penicillin-binding protein 5/6)
MVLKFNRLVQTGLGIFIGLVSCLSFLTAAPTPDSATPIIPTPPKIAASSYILIDANSGKVLVSHNADEHRAPASLTKVMTGYILARELAQGNVKLDDKALISEKAWRTPGSRMFVKEGTEVSLDDLRKGMIIQSGNDASVAIAEHLAGGEDAFAQLMNAQAKQLGMDNTHFVDATGLSGKNQYTSATDMATLARALINNYPKFYTIYSKKSFTYNNIKQGNRNLLLYRDNSVDGVKTGHTDLAGYNLIASAKRDGMRLISVVMGTKSFQARANESQKLLNYGFRFYQTVKLYSTEQKVKTVDVWLGKKDKVNLGVAQDLYITIPRNSEKLISAKTQLSDLLKAPIVAGKNYGLLKVFYKDEEIKEVPLIAEQSIEQAGFMARLWGRIKLFFYRLVN